MSWPLLFSLAFSLSLHFVDLFFLARVSDKAAAGVGALFPVLGGAIVVFSAVGQAGASVASQLLGARRDREVPNTYLALVLFCAALGVCTSSAFFLLRNIIPEWLGLTADLAGPASIFLTLVGGCQVLKAVQIAYANILNSRGATRWALAEALLTNVTNIALNSAFLHGAFGLPRLGVVGVALATVLSLAIGLLFTMCVVHGGFSVRFSTPRRASDLTRPLRSILRIGLPSALEPISYQCMQIVLNMLIVSWGTAAIAARVFVMNFYVLTTILWGYAFGIGTQILVAHCKGAGRVDAAHQELMRGLRFSISGNLVLAALLLLGHQWLLPVLTTDPEIVHLAGPGFWIGLLTEPARAGNIVAGGALRSTGDARYVSIVGTVMMWTLGLPACYILGQTLGLGLWGVWFGLALDELFRSIVNYRRWKSGRWRNLGSLTEPVLLSQPPLARRVETSEPEPR